MRQYCAVFLWVYDQPEPQETGGLYVSVPISVVLAMLNKIVQFPLVVSNLCKAKHAKYFCKIDNSFSCWPLHRTTLLGRFVILGRRQDFFDHTGRFHGHLNLNHNRGADSVKQVF